MERIHVRKEEGEGWKRVHRVVLLSETGLRLDDVQHLTRLPGESWKLVRCALNLSLVDAEGRERHAIVRYDNAHGFCHRDELFRDPPEKVWLDAESLEAFRVLAFEDLLTNCRAYLERYVSTYGSEGA